ncbi:hypothetical protein [Amycolatopsis sp. H20-H5]|uniref:hypothetical protein n=1 Tax=Amycolatopsis sp. H20-H5 TaxID=3046309 RepID=UPI002DB9D875|nr:hypothetical protein [Amycolatopsis sp. H20-H5]MEC3981397.1 hypothetical protein [Amycolatopsis sp. H20-H5]
MTALRRSETSSGRREFPPSSALSPGVGMKVVCSFSLLLRMVFWVAAIVLVIGVSLGSSAGNATPPGEVVPVVSVHGQELR